MKQGISVALVLMLFFSGCLSNDDTSIDKKEEILIEDTESSETVNSNETVNQTVIVKEPELIEVPYEEGCDNINPLHCMLPFPSNAFLPATNAPGHPSLGLSIDLSTLIACESPIDSGPSTVEQMV